MFPSEESFTQASTIARYMDRAAREERKKEVRRAPVKDSNGQIKTEQHLKIDAIQRELREQRKMLEQLLKINAQNNSIKPE